MNRLKDLRAKHGMSQADLGAILGVTANAVSNYEVGIRGLDAETIGKVCDIFGCTADYLLGRSSRPEPELTPEEEQLLAAWSAAPPEIRAIVDTALAPYKQDAASSSATA